MKSIFRHLGHRALPSVELLLGHGPTHPRIKINNVLILFRKAPELIQEKNVTGTTPLDLATNPEVGWMLTGEMPQ